VQLKQTVYDVSGIKLSELAQMKGCMLSQGIYGIRELMVDFPRFEYESRWKKAYALMDEQGIDALWIGREENLAYFGYRNPFPYMYFTFLVLPKDELPIIVAPVEMRGNVEAISWVEDTRFFAPSSMGFTDATETSKKLFKELGLSEKAVGLETSPRVTRQDVWDALKNSLKTTKIADDLIWKLRMIKSPLELRYIRKSCNITCKAFEKGLEAVHEGMTERELARIVYRTMIDEGCEDSPLRAWLNLRAGEFRYRMFDARPSDYKFRKGDIVILDGAAAFRGYFCDIMRLICIGQPNPHQKEMYEVCREAQEIGVEALQAGTPVQDVYDAVMNYLKKRGKAKNQFPNEPIGHGNGLGLEIHEPPMIAPGSDLIIEPGMVFSVEPVLYDDPVMKGIVEGYTPGGQGVFFVEDTILVTEKGNENLTPYPSKDLYVV